jgi:hypothetical protein
VEAPQDVDARDKPEHDEEGAPRRAIRVPDRRQKTESSTPRAFPDEWLFSTGQSWDKPGHDRRDREA